MARGRYGSPALRYGVRRAVYGRSYGGGSWSGSSAPSRPNPPVKAAGPGCLSMLIGSVIVITVMSLAYNFGAEMWGRHWMKPRVHDLASLVEYLEWPERDDLACVVPLPRDSKGREYATCEVGGTFGEKVALYYASTPDELKDLQASNTWPSLHWAGKHSVIFLQYHEDENFVPSHRLMVTIDRLP